MGDFMAGVVVLFLVFVAGFGILQIIDLPNTIKLWDKDWLCTKSERIGTTLPEEFECVQYSKRGKPNAK